MFPRISTLILACAVGTSLYAQVKPTLPAPKPVAPSPTPTVAPAPPQLKFKTLSSGIMYAFAVDKPGSNKPQEGDMIKVNMRSIASGRLLYDSYQANKGKAAEFGMNKPSFKGDISEVIAFMSPGDSLIAAVDADIIYKNTKNKRPDFIKKGDKIEYQIKLISIKSKEQVQKEQQAQMQKQMQEQLAKQKKDQEKAKIEDEKKLQAYFKKNNLTPTKTASGMYYTIIAEGNGQKPQNGYQVKMNYDGKLLDETKFDSNIDTAFGHVTPFEFKLGTGAVIRGWDEGVALLSKGSKAIFYIPSGMAYGSNARPGGGANPKGIPANSPLVFNVELLDFKEPANEDLALQTYFKDSGIQATKTASGLYYKINELGNGPLPQSGQKVVMNYTGRLMDGTKFDSNVDSAFNHVQPFEFKLGQGQVIKGWDEGIALLNQGTKATLYIPSALAYGAQSLPASAANPKGVPANSILLFDVELVQIKAD
jgi:FKBP-type peptidyl-prolyl cis-trans isomerase